MKEVIPHWLSKQADLKPNQLALEYNGKETLSFQELAQASQSMARRLANLGVEKGSHIALLSQNNVNMIIAIHALSYLGAVAVLLNTRLSANELQFQINDAKVNLLVTSVFFSDKTEGIDVPQKKSFSELQRLPEKEVPLQNELVLNDPFTIIYTSGTTGFPKGVVHTYGNHWWSAIGSALNLGISPQDKWLTVLPLFHVSGLSTLFKSVIYGMPIYLMTSFEPEKVHEALMKNHITMISVVTVMLQRLLEQMATERYPEQLRCVLLGGGPAPKPVLEQARKKEVPVFQSYGLTETSSQIVTLSPQDALRKIGSAGMPLVPAQLKIHDPSTRGVGEIYVKGPMVTKGYFNNPTADQKAFQTDWLKTGDLGYLDEEGFLYVVDRRNDLIISGGENIYPSEIESVVSELTGVQEVGVTNRSDDQWGEVPVAFIVKDTQNVLDEEMVQTYLKSRLASYKVPKKIYFVEQLPRNASNKLMRYKLKEWL
ncbi:MAG: o-succinylbenzoate--CoA ligase [Tetragenococcus halophilus]|nr:o-succinylbenzoate--CoA ligase [Tetragenococcus halophilus]MDN6257445.1 o-succinylbenzoate--CoA ligase [Tetragenococcus halophilus]MDN6265597.1 o-succinylbenzoate--CoA ligase [Tetragenococcus halophilus]MDN6504110.1 o-succinylbenzoate--CoA ligase [Tetragenococcus halophilus]